jgi:rhodanese-related sulfurtransferase
MNPMPQTITMGYRAMLAEAEAQIETLEVAEVRALLGRDDHVLVDLRDARELEREGIIPGAFHCPRGMLEFWIDPESPYAKPVFQQDKKFVFFCGGGWRSALAAKVSQEMGLKPVAHMRGGFSAWKAECASVEQMFEKAVSSEEMVARALKKVPSMDAQAARAVAADPNHVFIDIRDIRERMSEGAIAGSVHVPRSELEFSVDQTSPFALPLFAEDKTFVFYCGAGMASALAAEVAQRLGLRRVTNLSGGLPAFAAAGGPVVRSV